MPTVVKKVTGFVTTYVLAFIVLCMVVVATRPPIIDCLFVSGNEKLQCYASSSDALGIKMEKELSKMKSGFYHHPDEIAKFEAAYMDWQEQRQNRNIANAKEDYFKDLNFEIDFEQLIRESK